MTYIKKNIYIKNGKCIFFWCNYFIKLENHKDNISVLSSNDITIIFLFYNKVIKMENVFSGTMIPVNLETYIDNVSVLTSNDITNFSYK